MLSFIENDVQQSAILLYELTFHRFKLQINTTIMIIIKVQYIVITVFFMTSLPLTYVTLWTTWPQDRVMSYFYQFVVVFLALKIIFLDKRHWLKSLRYILRINVGSVNHNYYYSSSINLFISVFVCEITYGKY